MLRPRHFRDVDETFYARSNFDECTIVSEDNDLTLDLVAHLEVSVEAIPGMWLELLDTKSDALLSFVELEDNDVELLVEANNFAGVRYTAPREVGDVDETIDTTEVDEGTVRGDVLDDPFEDLTLLKLADDLSLLSFEFSFDEDLMRYDDVLEVLVDLDDLELHSLVDISIVVADRTDVDL